MILSNRLTYTWLTVCLGLHSVLLAWGAYCNSPTLVELAYLPAGVCHLETRRFELARVSPPLVRCVAAIPVYLSRPATDWSGLADLPDATADRDFAVRFGTANSRRLFWYFTVARWACIPFSLLGGLICFLWAKQLYGAASGLLAVTLWCFCPNILAHAQLMNADVGAAAFGVAASYCFWRWLKRPSWSAALLSGCVLGLTELTKTIWIVLFALWPLLWIAQRRQNGRHADTSVRSELAQLSMILGLAIMTINLGYLYYGSFQRLDQFQFISETLAGPSAATSPAEGGNRFAGTWMGSIPVPVPKDYLKGIDIQHHDFEKQLWSYLRGHWQRGGWWYYYLYGLAIKVPIGTWGLAILALAAAPFATGYTAGARDEWMLLAPLLVVLIFVSAQTGFSHHLRYVLPILPFAFILISRVARCIVLRQRACGIVVAALLSWSVASSLAIYPHTVAYFNETIGGPTRGHMHLLNSNLDWCQDLLFLKHWVDRHPQARPIKLAYQFPLLAHFANIDFATPRATTKRPNGAPQWPPGWYAISANDLHDRTGQYEQFLELTPTDRAGYSICIYRLDADSGDSSSEDANTAGLNHDH